MKSIAHIAVATDFSATANQAVDVARRLASHEGARLSLIHVFDPAPLSPALAYPVQVWTGSEFEREMRARALEMLETTRSERLADLPDVGLVALHHASPVSAICDHAETQNVDLVVTGTHGHTGLDHLLLGSVAERLIRHAPCSVLTVRQGLDPERFPSHLLVCTDFSAASEPALDEAALLARRFAARVTLCHVYDQAPSPLQRQARELRGLDDLDVATALRQALERLGDRFDGEVHHAIVAGDDPAQTIAEQAGASGADLVVVATHGRTGLSRMIIGSVAEKVARLAPHAVWIARTPPRHLA